MYNEDDAIRHIRRSTAGMLDPYDDDQILNVIDAVWDWQEANGFLEIDADDADEEPDPADIISYVRRMLARDAGNRLPDAVLAPIVMAELEYENMTDDTL